MARNVLIIGGTRFLGAAITRSFVGEGDRVCLMNRGTYEPPCEGVESMVCDKADRTAFAALLKQHSWDVVVDTILNDEDLSFVIDAVGTDVGMFIHTGSLGVYGAVRKLPARESEPLCEYDGETVVFNHKLRQDQVLMRFSTQHMCASTAKIEAELGWRSEISLGFGLRENMEWMREKGHV